MQRNKFSLKNVRGTLIAGFFIFNRICLHAIAGLRSFDN